MGLAYCAVCALLWSATAWRALLSIAPDRGQSGVRPPHSKEVPICTVLGGGAVDAGETFTRDRPAPFNHFAGYDELLDAFLRGQGIH